MLPHILHILDETYSVEPELYHDEYDTMFSTFYYLLYEEPITEVPEIIFKILKILPLKEFKSHFVSFRNFLLS